MTCRETIDFIADFLDGALHDEVREEFERHLALCPSCAAYVDGYRKTVQLGMTAMSWVETPSAGSVPDGLIKAIRAARAKDA